jgi:Methyltransferase domain
MPNLHADRSVYESGEYLAKNPTWHEEDAGWKFGHLAQLLDRNSLRPASVIEVGTGSGEVLRLVSERFPEADCVGFDISPQAIKIAAQKSRPKLAFRQGSALGQSGYELALAMDVFEHVEDYLGFLRQMPALAEYQAYNIPLDLSARYVLQPHLIMGARESVGHLHYFIKDTALASLVDTGHEVIDFVYHSPSFSRKDAKGALRRWLFRLNPDLCVRLMGGFSMTVLCRRP